MTPVSPQGLGSFCTLQPPVRGELARLGSREWWRARNRVSTRDQPCPLPRAVPWPVVAVGWLGTEEEEEEGGRSRKEGSSHWLCRFWEGSEGNFGVLEASSGC